MNKENKLSEEIRNQIDTECLPLVDFFNEIGLKTSMCCQGHNTGSMHKFWVQFHSSIGDKEIDEFIRKLPNPIYVPRLGKQIKGKFLKIHFGYSKKGENLARWKYEVDNSGDPIVNQAYAHNDLEIYKNYIRMGINLNIN